MPHNNSQKFKCHSTPAPLSLVVDLLDDNSPVTPSTCQVTAFTESGHVGKFVERLTNLFSFNSINELFTGVQVVQPFNALPKHVGDRFLVGILPQSNDTLDGLMKELTSSHNDLRQHSASFPMLEISLVEQITQRCVPAKSLFVHLILESLLRKSRFFNCLLGKQRLAVIVPTPLGYYCVSEELPVSNLRAAQRYLGFRWWDGPQIGEFRRW